MNDTLIRWNKAEYGEWSPGGSFGPMPLPSEVNGPVEMPTPEEIKGYVEDTALAHEKGLWHAPKRYNRTTCATCHTQLPLTGNCDFC
jgi:hypothetical protein